MQRLYKLLIVCWAVLLITMLGAETTNAQSRSLRWQRYDVDISNIQTSANKFDVTETYELVIEIGSFGGGDVTIPMGRLTDITDIVITDGGQPLKQRDTTEVAQGTFYYAKSSDNFTLTYDFIQRASVGETRIIQFMYTVTGALRSYQDGDQLYWVAIPSDKPIPVMNSRVTVQMPEGIVPQMYVSYPNTWLVSTAGNTLTWEAPSTVGPSDSLEVRVQYAHDPTMSAPPWQSAFDSQRNSSETSQMQPTFVTALIVALIVFFHALLFGL
jgi:hypothetical protein